MADHARASKRSRSQPHESTVRPRRTPGVHQGSWPRRISLSKESLLGAHYVAPSPLVNTLERRVGWWRDDRPVHRAKPTVVGSTTWTCHVAATHHPVFVLLLILTYLHLGADSAQVWILARRTQPRPCAVSAFASPPHDCRCLRRLLRAHLIRALTRSSAACASASGMARPRPRTTCCAR